MKFQAGINRFIVEVDKKKETSDGGLILPEQTDDLVSFGKVVNYNLRPEDWEEDEEVKFIFFLKSNGVELEYKKSKYISVDARNVLAYASESDDDEQEEPSEFEAEQNVKEHLGGENKISPIV